MTKPILEIAKELLELESESELCVVCLAPCEYHRDSEGTQSARSIITNSQLRTLCEALVTSLRSLEEAREIIKSFTEAGTRDELDEQGNHYPWDAVLVYHEDMKAANEWLKKWGGE